jgi:hypothetical protein
VDPHRNAPASDAAERFREYVMPELDVLLRVVSPLAMQPLVGRERRAIFAGVADRVVSAAEADSLWRHWERPRIAWYQGTHRAFLGTAEGRTFIATALHSAGVLPKESA